MYIYIYMFVIDCATWTVAGGYVRATFHVSLFYLLLTYVVFSLAESCLVVVHRQRSAYWKVMRCLQGRWGLDVQGLKMCNRSVDAG